MAISESVAWTDQHLKALLLISRGTDDLDGESGTELTLRFYQSGKCRWLFGKCLLLDQLLD